MNVTDRNKLVTDLHEKVEATFFEKGDKLKPEFKGLDNRIMLIRVGISILYDDNFRTSNVKVIDEIIESTFYVNKKVKKRYRSFSLDIKVINDTISKLLEY